jgi:hypothetical protein
VPAPISGKTNALQATEADLENLNLYGDLTSLPKSEDDDSLEGGGGGKGETDGELRGISVPVAGTEEEKEASDTPRKKVKNGPNNPSGAKQVGRKVWKEKMEQRQNALTATASTSTRTPEVGNEVENEEQEKPRAKRQRTTEIP